MGGMIWTGTINKTSIGEKHFRTVLMIQETIQARKLNDWGPNKWTLKGVYSTRFPDSPESVLAYQRNVVQDMLSWNNLRLDKIYDGAWSNSENYLAYQDILIVNKQK